MWVATALFVVAYVMIGVLRYSIYRAEVDTGLFVQVLSSAFSGFHSTAEGGFNHLAVHFSPTLFLIAPLVIATHSTYALIAVQAIAIGLTAPAIFLIARKRMSGALAALCAICALVYPPLGGVTLSDFHEVALEPAFIAWLIWAIDANKHRVALVLALLALGIKEDVAPALVFGGLVSALWFRRRSDTSRARLMLVIAGCSAAVFVAYFAVLRPLLHAPRYATSGLYDYHRAFYPQLKLAYVENVFAPLLLLPLLSPALVLALPGLAEVLGAHAGYVLPLETHYAGAWLAYVLVAFAGGVAFFYRRAKLVAWIVVLGAFVACMYTTIWIDPAHRWFFLYRWPNAHDAAMNSLLASLPPDADVTAPLPAFAHLGFDPNARFLPGGKYLIVDTAQTSTNRDLRGYHIVRTSDGIKLYER